MTNLCRLFLFLVFAIGIAASAFAFEIQEIETPSGIKAWMVEDHSVPIISISMQFKGGSNQDPNSKEGLGSVLASTMLEGAGPLTALELKAEIEDLGLETGISANRDNFTAGMRMIKDDAPRAFYLLGQILNNPKFEEKGFERIKASYSAFLTRQEQRPRSLLRREFRRILFNQHTYARPDRGTVESMALVTRDDLLRHKARLIARSNLSIGVVGAITKEELVPMLEEAFAGLPEQAELTPVPDAEPHFGIRSDIKFDSAQASISLALPGLPRKDPDFFAAYLMNHILGGGSFSSRLYQEIREKRGLTYGVGSAISNLEHANYIGAGLSTSPDNVGQVIEILKTEIRRMADEGPTSEELEAARQYVLGAYAINNLDTSLKVAEVLVALQVDDLGKNYIESRRDEINAVTLDQVKRVAKRLMSVEPTIVTIGPAG